MDLGEGVSGIGWLREVDRGILASTSGDGCTPLELTSRNWHPKRKSLEKVSKSLEEVSRARGPESPKKVSKKVRKVSKNPFSDFFLTSRTFFETLFGLRGPGPVDFCETFLRLFGFGPRDSFSQVHGTSNLVIITKTLFI